MAKSTTHADPFYLGDTDSSEIQTAVEPRGHARTENEPSASFTIFAVLCGISLFGMLFGASLWILAGVAAAGVLLSLIHI